MERDLRFAIGSSLLDRDRGLLTRDGTPVPVRAKTFALIRHLAENRGRLLSKDELFDQLWPGLSVSENTLTQTVRDARKALAGDAGILQTVPRRGYLLAGSADSAAEPAAPPRVVVFPFLCHSAQPDDAALIDGIVEEITHGLGRYGLIRVVARHSAFRFRPESANLAKAARELGADYFVEGTARRGADGLNASVALCGTESGRQTWFECFAITGDPLHFAQAVLPHRIITRLMLDVERRIAIPPAASGTRDLDAYQSFVVGVACLRRYGEGVNEAGLAHLERALALDPDFALAHAYVGLALLMLGDYVDLPPSMQARAHDSTARAIHLAPEEGRCHWIAGILAFFQHEYAAAELHMGRALSLNPHDPDFMALMGRLAAARGRPGEGLAWLDQAFALNPLHPPWYHCDMSGALHAAGRWREAIAHLNCVPRSSWFQEMRLAACHAMLDEPDQAAAHLRCARDLVPGRDLLADAAGIEAEHEADRQRFVAEVARAQAALAARERF
ncbi:winged helix-turn-helix domain-containing protein [Albidovulum sp.]|uniref:winged helix-turn-helix domain-containing protein n=1 Tax=Albidovulum sp. TaxID=1872424 RepID=UPI0039B8B8F2